MRMSGSVMVAIANAMRATMPEEKFFMGMSTKSGSSANSTISWKCASMNSSV